jgi:Fic family protein
MGKPPFTLTLDILNLMGEIEKTIGALLVDQLGRPSVLLRKQNKIKTVQHSLAIEGNQLSTEQITAILENKRVLGPQKQILEVQNALEVYEQLESFNPMAEKDFLRAHSVLMRGLLASAGRYRTNAVGIFKGKKISHIAPQAKMLPALMKDLFAFLKEERQVPWAIKACVFHYELEFIHPLEDGNGRMGRLWQQLILMKHSPVFEYLSIESLIHQKQNSYYKVLEECDRKGDSTAFIVFMLGLILQALKEFKKAFRPDKLTGAGRVQRALEEFKSKSFSRKDYLELFRDISTATASRDLASAVEEGIIERKGEKALALYRRA